MVKPLRKVLAFYSDKVDEPEAAYKALRLAGCDPLTIYRQDGSVKGADRRTESCGSLRLEGESLIVALTRSNTVTSIVKVLTETGAPAMFVLREDDQALPATDKSAILSRLREHQAALEMARNDLLEASRLDHSLTAAAEWILDNAYLIRTQVTEVRRHLPRDYLKILSRDTATGNPRVYELAKKLTAKTDFAVDQANIVEYLKESQQEQCLSVAELWMFPLLLRVTLIEGLAGLARRVDRAQQLRELAYLWANRLGVSARGDSAAFSRMMSLMEAEPFALESGFVTSLAEQLQDEESALAPIQHWIEKRLNTGLTELVRREHTQETAERLSTANGFGSLRALSRIDFTEIFEATSVVEAELQRDPGGIYPHSDFSTRDQCRRVVERIARSSKLPEVEVAKRAVALASHGAAAKATDAIEAQVAYYLLAEGVVQLEADVGAAIPVRMRLIRTLRRHAAFGYVSSIATLTACLLGLSCRLAWDGGIHERGLLAGLGILALFPLSELSTQIVNALVISLMPPDPLPKMDFREGNPADHATLVTVPMMLTNIETVRKEVEKLEVRFLSNQEDHLHFSLFCDFVDWPEAAAPKDAELLNTIRTGIEDLNTRYPGRHFVVFHRPRVWSESEQVWMGRERKRGKIEELNEYLAGELSSDIVVAGQLPERIRYVITLDSDTQLPPGTARRLIETIAHPLNHAEFDPRTRRRLRGYTVIQPRVSIALPGAIASRFTRVFAETTGTDPYSQAVSDAHQDLFGEATFHGKAIYEVSSFRAAVGDRFPAESILSHDLIEGAHAGVGLATDIEVFENLPLDYAGYSKREHRWIRGDWQIAPWIRRRVPGPDGRLVPTCLSPINRWRIFDNLRRSLVPVASMLLLLFGWMISAAPGVWSLVVGLAVVIPTLAPLLDRLARRIQGTAYRWHGAAAEFVRAMVAVSFLPHQAWISADAIVRALYRMHVSHRKLLEWQPAEATDAGTHAHRNSTYRQMSIVSGVSVVLLMLQYAQGELASTAVFLGLWILSPGLMRWLAHPASPTARRGLSRADHTYLRLLARRTWRYFDDLVGPNTNWLPPDNSQLALRIEVAQRTSPTNIGLWMTSALAATDFGYLTADDFLKRCEQTLVTIAKLERYEGHLLNWYDIQTLQPLAPRYISTVDSGNLLASLWVLEQGCDQLLRRPVVGQACLRGLHDTLTILRELTGTDPSVAGPTRELRRLLSSRIDGHHLVSRLMSSLPTLQRLQESTRWHEPEDERAYWASHAAHDLESWVQTSDRYLRWMRTLTQPPDSFLRELAPDAVKVRRRAVHVVPSLLELAGGGPPALQTVLGWRATKGISPEASAWLNQLAAEIKESAIHAAETVSRFEQLAASLERVAAGINMRFLYDRNRRLFAVGYAVGGPADFNSHYDLLASECRLASLVAIAKGDAPVQHWFSLSRPRVLTSGGQQALLSWSGTMFEYLMPLIFMRTYDNSLLDLACREAVRQQIAYGWENQVPWGCSESAFSALDSNQIYQYRAFGVPTLALKPGVDEDLVVAPYATMLAMLVDPAESVANLRQLESLGLAGPMGLYESIDFGRENKEDGERGVPIYAYMAHHQGMSLAALDDVLHRGVMRQRFHADVRVRAVESLLFEGVPITRPPADEFQTGLMPVRLRTSEDPVERTWKRDDSLFPRVHLQGNGRYSLMVTNSGGGYSRWNDFDVTRWRADPTIDTGGSYVYIRDLGSQTVWSATHRPMLGDAADISVRFSADRAEFQRNSFGIETILAVTVAADEDAELRRLTITNQSRRVRQLELTSYVELAMAPHAADASHPAFSKMFVQTDQFGDDALIAWRRKREPGDSPIWTAHLIVGATGEISRETDRAKFLGRANSLANAAALTTELKGEIGTVLDPIFSLRCRLSLKPRDRTEITFLTIAANSREALIEAIERYRRPESGARTFEVSWTRAQLEFRYLGIGPAAAHRFQELAGHLIFPTVRLRPSPDRLVQNELGQAGLWAYGISGDLPIVAVTIADARNLPLVRELLLAHAYWRLRGFQADLIILNQEGSSYDRPLHQKLLQQIEAHSAETGIDRPGGVFLRDWNAIPEAQRQLILASARVVLGGSRGSVQQQLTATGGDRPALPLFVPAGGKEEPSAPLPFLELPYFNGLGGFTQDGREYAIYLQPRANTPSPWVNVIANPNFGTMITESGLGFTWCGNSQSNRLTPWHNDPIVDPQSEAIYLRDDETGALWSPTPLPIREQDAYRARHGQGYTVFEHNSHAIEQELTVFVPTGERLNDPVKICRLRLRNTSSRPRRLTVTYFAEWVLGSSREQLQTFVQVSRDAESGAIIAKQTWSGEYAGHCAFAASTPPPTSFSGDRTQFLGRYGSTARPAALGRRSLDNRAAAGMDPCAALQVSVAIQPGQEQDLVFLLGQTKTIDEVRTLVRRYSELNAVDEALRETRQWWDEKLGVLQVRTPLLSVDLLLNRWLPYQALSCRMWARSAMYQSSGAFGFRDQLQDSMALVYAAPELARQHILTAAARQFIEGDVQHWWHADAGIGVRTRCSDDLAWLPKVVAHYVAVTGDRAILDVDVPFLEGPVLAAHETEHMFTPVVSTQSAPLWEHCRRALDRAWQLGAHGLPLFGSGDWNDGMNRVGVEGRGESVWLGWFLCEVSEAFSRILETHESGSLSVTMERTRRSISTLWRTRASELASALANSTWDGEWYLRGFFDSGEPLGSRMNSEAQIDSIAQSWAVLSGVADPNRARKAMESADRLLVDEKNRLVKLFTPPFDHSEPHPGYIMGYPPGLRENGGQYTHGSLWLAAGWARLGEGARAVHLLTLMNPVEHTRNPEMVAGYRGEPYVASADVYAAPGRMGQSGWTWYTGSAAWMYRIWLEEVLGFHLAGDKLTIAPVTPPDWEKFEIRYKYRSSTYEIEVRWRLANANTIELDGRPLGDVTVRLRDDGAVHKVTVWMARQADKAAAEARRGDGPTGNAVIVKARTAGAGKLKSRQMPDEET